MSNTELEQRLNLLEKKVNYLQVKNTILEFALSSFFYSAMVSGKISTKWATHRIQEIQQDLDRFFEPSQSAELAETYKQIQPNSFLQNLIVDIETAKDLEEKLDLTKYHC